MTNDVTRILQQLKRGDSAATESLLPVVYSELKQLAAAKMAQERENHTLQATDLVNEAYLRLVDGSNRGDWNSRAHFFGAAAEAMRRILIDHARAVKRQKRGPEYQRVPLELLEPLKDHSPDELLSLNEAVDQLASENETMAELVKLRIFAGLSNQQAADIIGIPQSTAKKHWLYARAWLRRKLTDV